MSSWDTNDHAGQLSLLTPEPPDDSNGGGASEDLPQNPEAERAVLGVALRDPTAVMDELADRQRLRADHFHVSAHRRLFQAMAALVGEGKLCDLISIAQYLDEKHGAAALHPLQPGAMRSDGAAGLKKRFPSSNLRIRAMEIYWPPGTCSFNRAPPSLRLVPGWTGREEAYGNGGIHDSTVPGSAHCPRTRSQAEA